MKEPFHQNGLLLAVQNMKKERTGNVSNKNHIIHNHTCLLQ